MPASLAPSASLAPTASVTHFQDREASARSPLFAPASASMSHKGRGRKSASPPRATRATGTTAAASVGTGALNGNDIDKYASRSYIGGVTTDGEVDALAANRSAHTRATTTRATAASTATAGGDILTRVRSRGDSTFVLRDGKLMRVRS